MEISRHQPPTTAGEPEHFSGQVLLDTIGVAPSPGRARVLRVHFAPGARTHWHRHPFGQVLHVLSGEARVQSRGGPVERLRAGETAVAAPSEWHWHGAGPETAMAHLAVQEADGTGSTTEWGEAVEEAPPGA